MALLALALAAFMACSVVLAWYHVWAAFAGYGAGIAVWGLAMLASRRRDG
jgi:hypothetical protein